MKGKPRMIYTSHFGMLAHLLQYFKPSELVSIARNPPGDDPGSYMIKGMRSYRLLAPSWELLTERNMGRISLTQFNRKFLKDCLRPLRPEQILHDLMLQNDDCVLLCYEHDPMICHRRVVGFWLQDNFSGLEVNEWEPSLMLHRITKSK
jgi:hypothetical protein